MTTSRKKPSSFAKSTEEELVLEEQTLDETLIESMNIIDESPVTVEVVAEKKPFVEESIVPTSDPGPRFLENTAPAPEPVEPKKLPELMPPPKRHPRNVPRFSRTR